jgi:hypothetical protein
LYIIVGIQTKGKHGCPKIAYHYLSSLGKQVYDECKNFLLKNHSYKTIENHISNGKEENKTKP